MPEVRSTFGDKRSNGLRVMKRMDHDPRARAGLRGVRTVPLGQKLTSELAILMMELRVTIWCDTKTCGPPSPECQFTTHQAKQVAKCIRSQNALIVDLRYRLFFFCEVDPRVTLGLIFPRLAIVTLAE